MAIVNPEEEERRAYCEWLTANGISPRSVPRESTFAITDEPDGQRLIRYIEFVLTDDGRIQVDPEARDTVWKRPATAPCVVEPPASLKVPGSEGQRSALRREFGEGG